MQKITQIMTSRCIITFQKSSLILKVINICKQRSLFNHILFCKPIETLHSLFLRKMSYFSSSALAFLLVRHVI